MGINHLVKVTSFLARPQDIPAYAKVRDKYLGDKGHVVVVQALARPIYLIEVEATAARDGAHRCRLEQYRNILQWSHCRFATKPHFSPLARRRNHAQARPRSAI